MMEVAVTMKPPLKVMQERKGKARLLQTDTGQDGWRTMHPSCETTRQHDGLGFLFFLS
jgi:hypothetical protein